MLRKFLPLFLITLALAGCDNVSYVQRDSPVNAFKEYRENGSAVLGVGEPISKRQMQANATLRAEGALPLGGLMERVADTYNVAVRYGAGVRQEMSRDLLISDLKFNEARNYIEDTYEVQIVREGERRLLVLPAANVARIESFDPGSNIPLVEAVRAMSMQCDMNLVINENRNRLVNTRVSAAFEDITCTDAFDAVLAPHGMTLVDKGDYYSIGGLPSRTWSLNLFEPLREESQSISYDANLGGSEGGISGNTTTGGGGGGGGDAASASGGGSSDITTRQDRDLIQELLTGLESLLDEACDSNSSGGQQRGVLSPPGGGGSGGGATISASCGYVQINRSVGLVQMQAPRDVLQAADKLIKRTEDIASRRLLVEARILAVNRDRSFKQGGVGAGRIDTGSNSDISLGFDGGLVNEEFDLSPSESVSGLLSDLAGAGGGFGIRDNSVQGFLNFLETFTTTYQLMQPTLEVMDRQKAVMIDGRNDVFFIRESQVITSGGDNTVNNVTATERRQFEGIQFSVTAQIADGEEPHTLHLQIPITEIVGTESLQQTFNDETFTDEIPIVNTRIIDQKVRARDGEVKVVGGLTRTMAVDRESGIPLLRGVPVAGKAVNDETVEFEEVEFLVLLQAKRLR